MARDTWVAGSSQEEKVQIALPVVAEGLAKVALDMVCL